MAEPRMPISRKDLARLELAMQADSRHYPLRYASGVEHSGIYRVFGLWPDKLREVEQVDGEWRENAFLFLEANPRFFRSGYDKAQLLRRLKRADLSRKHLQRLHKVLLGAVETGGGVEFRQYCQLAAHHLPPGLLADLSKLAKTGEPDVRRRAVWMLDSVRAAKSSRSK